VLQCSPPLNLNSQGCYVFDSLDRPVLTGRVLQPLLVPGDLTDEETVRRTVEQTIAHYGRLDVLVNSAGILAMGSIETADLAQYDRVMAINVRWDSQASQVSFLLGVFPVGLWRT